MPEIEYRGFIKGKTYFRRLSITIFLLIALPTWALLGISAWMLYQQTLTWQQLQITLSHQPADTGSIATPETFTSGQTPEFPQQGYLPFPEATKTSTAQTAIAQEIPPAAETTSPAPTVSNGNQTPSGQLSLILAIVNLRDNIFNGEKYVFSLQAAETAASGNIYVQEQLLALKPHAHQGVKTIEILAKDFATQIDALVNSERVEKQDPSLSDKVALTLSGVVSVRDVTERAGTIEDTISRTEKYLANKDLYSAITALEQLQGTQSLIVKSWLTDAKATLGTNQSIESLYNRIASPPFTR